MNIDYMTQQNWQKLFISTILNFILMCLMKNYSDVEVRVLMFIFIFKIKSQGGDCCDYYEAKGLLESTADEAISVDSDLMFVSDEG